MPQNTFGHLRTILDSFRNLKPSWSFSWIFSKYLPRILSPENRFQIVSVQKTEHIVLCSGIRTHNFKSRKSGKGLRIMTVAWMQTKCLLSILSENWTHVFKSRKSEKPCLEHWAKKFPKNRPKACSKHIWTLLGTIFGTFGILKLFWFFRKFSKARPSMEHWAKLFFRKTCPKTCSKQVWTILWTILGLFGFLKFFDDSNFHGTLGKIFFSKKMLQNTFGHLRTILDSFRSLKPSWFFSWIFSKYLPRILSPENRFQNVSVQKTEHIVLSSGIWTHNFKSRKSGKGFRILTVAWMQKECLLSIVS